MKANSRMTLGRGIKDGAMLLGGILFALGAGFLYQKLTGRQIGTGAFTYSLSYTVPVVLCAAAAYMIAVLRIRRMIGDRAGVLQEEEIALPEEVEAVQDIPDDTEYNFSDMQEEEPAPTAAQQRAEKIASALAAQRAEQRDIPLQEELYQKDDEGWDALYRAPEPTEDAAARELYADLPQELPEGYELPWASEEETEDFWEDEDMENFRPRSPVREVLPVLCAVSAFVLILLLAASFWTKAGEEGICVSRFGKVRAYTWDQVTAYTVDAGFAGGEMKLTLQMKDGKQVKIAPSSYAQTSVFSDQYENLYQYWLHADNMLAAAGADKTVVQTQYLADTYMSGEEEIWYYVRQIIEYREEDLWD